MSMVADIIAALEREIASLPGRFYDSFDYTTTGQNFTHPITLGILSRLLWQIPGVIAVAVDLRLNNDEAKFQPDLVALESVKPFRPLAFVDYESPNSSDMRIPEKDAESYMRWHAIHGHNAPYLIITTLPTHPVPDWELRYTDKGNLNEAFKGLQKSVAASPFKFWYEKYRHAIRGTKINNIHFINIDGKKVYEVPFSEVAR